MPLNVTTHLMPGISRSLFLGAAVILTALSLVLVVLLEARARRARGTAPCPRLDLLRSRGLKALVTWRPFQFVVRLPFVLLFLFIIVAGFAGTQTAGGSIAPFVTWTVWWATLILFILFLGKIWCLVCPWNALAEWLQRLTFWKKKETTTSMGLKWPRRLRNIYLATGLFAGLTWLELGFGVTLSAWATAGLGVLILALAMVPAMYFDKKPFCRYGCLVGRVSGLYALFSPVELRARDQTVCRDRCRTRDCVRGNAKGYGCPTEEYLGTMDLNTYCILCTECVKTCPHDNVAFNVRPFASDLVKSTRLRADEAYLAIAMLALTAFHGMTMTSPWGDAVGSIQKALGGGNLAQVGAFTLGMAGILAAPVVLLYGVSWLSRALAGAGLSLRQVFIGYAYSLLPVALFYHLAHNIRHLLHEGQRLVPLLSDPLGKGWDLFGAAGLTPGPIMSLSSIQKTQVVLVVLGQLFAVYVAFHVSRRLPPGTRARALSLAPVLVTLAAFSVLNLGLLAQPMMMRSAM